MMNLLFIYVPLFFSLCCRNVVGLAIGYSKAIVVDMGFCLQVTCCVYYPAILHLT